jgi:hypothetical protein
MAERQSMTIDEVVRRVMVDEHADVLRESVRLVVQELMDAEVSELIGAAHGERKPDGRMTQRNGYRYREWDTRAGVIDLQIPKLRQGSYFPASILEPRRRGEQALLAVVQQAYVCGVSTRRVDQLVESLGLRISRSEVSRICALLDEQVEAFRCRPLEGEVRSDNARIDTPRTKCSRRSSAQRSTSSTPSSPARTSRTEPGSPPPRTTPGGSDLNRWRWVRSQALPTQVKWHRLGALRPVVSSCSSQRCQVDRRSSRARPSACVAVRPGQAVVDVDPIRVNAQRLPASRWAAWPSVETRA